MDEKGELQYLDAVPTVGNVLDVAVGRDGTIVYAYDHIHVPWQRDQVKDDICPNFFGCIRYNVERGHWQSATEDECPATMDEPLSEDIKEVDLKPLRSLLYGCENFRKRRKRAKDGDTDDADNVVDK